MSEITVTDRPSLTVWQRLAGIIAYPRETFEEIVAKPHFWQAVVLSVTLSLLLNLALIPKLSAFVRFRIANTPGVPAEQLALMQAYAAKGAVITTILLSITGLFVAWAVFAVLLKAINLFAGEKTSFEKLFAVAVFAYVPVLIGDIVQAALRLSAPVQRFGEVTTSLAVLVPAQPGLLYTILSRIEPFTIWTLVLLSLGGAIAIRANLRTLVAGVFGAWLIYNAAYVALVTIAGSAPFGG